MKTKLQLIQIVMAYISVTDQNISREKHKIWRFTAMHK